MQVAPAVDSNPEPEGGLQREQAVESRRAAAVESPPAVGAESPLVPAGARRRKIQPRPACPSALPDAVQAIRVAIADTPPASAAEEPELADGPEALVDLDIEAGAAATSGPSDSRGDHGADLETPGRSPAVDRGSPPPVRHEGFVRRSWLPVAVALTAAFVAGTGYLWATAPPALDGLGRWGPAGDGQVAQQQEQQQQAPAEPVEQPAHRPPAASPAWADAATNPNPFGAATQSLPGPPTRLTIPAIGIDTALESLHLDKSGDLTPPQDFARAGWYADGTAPGDNGPAVIAGHVDSYRGAAVFYKLRELVPGDRVDVLRGGTTVQFTVVSTAWYPKTKFPTDKVYGPTPDRQLRLITCGGVFDHSLRSYKDNLVVYAVAG